MSSPTFSDAVDAQADAAAKAYSPACEDQGRVLGSVNKRREETRKDGMPMSPQGTAVCGDPDESEFAECDVQEAGDCPGG